MTRQLISRIDDDLHMRLKARAAAEGRSLNDLVSNALHRLVAEEEELGVLASRMRRLDLLEWPEEVEAGPGRDAVIERTKGAGAAVSEALTADRERLR